MNTSSSSSVVPPGYRFYPTEEELISFFLQNKLDNRREDMEQVIPVVDVYSFDPWLLPEMSGEPCRRDGEEWFFFCPRQERETLGGKPNRTTPSGYWKATGTSSNVISSANRVLGMKRTMVFYQGRAAHGTKTHWKMNEYRAIMVDGGAASAASSSNPPPRFRNEFSLCRVYTQSGYIRSFDRRPAVVAASDAQRIVPNEEAPPPPPSTTAGDAQRIAPNEEAPPPPPPPPPPPLPLATAATISGTEPPGAASPAINSLSHEHSSSSDGNGASQRFARPGGQLDELQLDPGENDDDYDDDLFHLDWF